MSSGSLRSAVQVRPLAPEDEGPERYHRVVRREEIVEVVEVRPLTVADMPADREGSAPEPANQPQPVKA